MSQNETVAQRSPYNLVYIFHEHEPCARLNNLQINITLQDIQLNALQLFKMSS